MTHDSTPLSPEEITALLMRGAGGLTPDITPDDVAPESVVTEVRRHAQRASRRRSLLAITGTATACIALAVGSVALRPWVQAPDAPVATTPQASDAPVPQGHQRLGIGQIHVDLPDDFSRGSQQCSTEGERVWRFDSDPVPLCGPTPPAWGAQVTLGLVPLDVTLDHEGTEVSLPGGGSGFRSPTTCAPVGDVEQCAATLWARSGQRTVVVSVQSSEGAESIDAVLDAVRRGVSIGVPAPSSDNNLASPTDKPGNTDEVNAYEELLREWSLEPELTSGSSGESLTPSVSKVHPGPGTLLAPGSAVEVEVTRVVQP